MERSKRKAMGLAIAGIAGAAAIACTTVSAPPARYGIRASAEPALIERGRYLVYGPAHCAACHADPALERELHEGREVPLSGGRSFALGPLGTVVAPNITSDAGAGVGGLSDDTLVRSLRDGISRNGRPLVPLMSFANLADEDLRAIVSYLRTVDPVAQPATPNRLSLLGKIGVNVFLRRHGPGVPPPARLAPAPTAEYGRYVAHTVANCHGCHTQRNKLTGGFVGPDFGGGLVFEEPEGTFVTPDLRAIAAALSEREFVERFRVRGRVHRGSPMPWEAFARMTETDLVAVHRYLHTLQSQTAIKE